MCMFIYFQMPSTKSMVLKSIILLEMLILVTANLNDGSRHRYCGTHLRTTLSLFCQGQYESMNIVQKKSGGKILCIQLGYSCNKTRMMQFVACWCFIAIICLLFSLYMPYT